MTRTPCSQRGTSCRANANGCPDLGPCKVIASGFQELEEFVHSSESHGVRYLQDRMLAKSGAIKRDGTVDTSEVAWDVCPLKAIARSRL